MLELVGGEEHFAQGLAGHAAHLGQRGGLGHALEPHLERAVRHARGDGARRRREGVGQEADGGGIEVLRVHGALERRWRHLGSSQRLVAAGRVSRWAAAPSPSWRGAAGRSGQAHALLEVADVLVAVRGERGRGLVVLEHDRAQEDHQVGALAVPRLVLEEAADPRQVAQERHLVDARLLVVLDEAAEHDDLAVVHEHRGFERALVGDDVGGAHELRLARDARDFLEDGELHRAALGHLRRDLEGEADVLALDGLERVSGECRRTGV